MDFSDEPYVRKYTRKTLTNRLLGWEGRAVVDAMLGEFDAAGVFDFRGDPARAISAVTEIPMELARLGLERALETETWSLKGSRLLWPTYEEAQNCSRSDRIRQRLSRKERAAAVANDPPSRPTASVTPPAPVVTDVTRAPAEHGSAVTDVTRAAPDVTPVTLCGGPNVTDVTSGHSESQHVTLPPFAPSHPPTHPGSHTREARAGSGGVTRSFTMPGPEPPREYLDLAVMSGVSPVQATATWKHYYRAGLPEFGVERLHPWLIAAAAEYVTRKARLPVPAARGAPDAFTANRLAHIERLKAEEAAAEEAEP